MASCGSAVPVLSEPRYSRVNSGAASMATAVASSRASPAMVSSRRVNASPPSASSVWARTSSGTITLLSTPPRSSS